MALLKQVGAMPDVSKSKASKLLHTGKGKMRNRRYTMRRGPLVVYDQDEGIQAAFRNIPGVGMSVILYRGRNDELRRDSPWQLDFSQARPDQLTVYINLNSTELDIEKVQLPVWSASAP